MYGTPRSAKWTPEQDVLLTEALRKRTSLQRLVVRFNRSAGTIKARAAELGLEIPKPVRAPREDTRSKARWAAAKPR
jgi:hypothetical protein